MNLSMNGMKDRGSWERAGIVLPGYDVERVSAKAKEAPVWVHFGIGNIFRVFIGGIADGLLEKGELDRESPAWKHLIMMWSIKYISPMMILA